jgi:hypothetical protein
MTARHETDLDHPTESELADLALGGLDDSRSGAVSDHVRGCPPCRLLFDRLLHGLPELPAGDPPREPRIAVPEAALGAIAAADRPKTGARPGELWRARQRPGDPVTVVWVRALGSTGAAVVPVSFDTELADDYTLIVPAAASPLGTSLAVHVSIETTVDTRYLLDRLGSVDVTSAVESIRAARENGEPAQGQEVGPTVASPLDERIEYRQVLADRLAELAPATVGQEPEAPARDVIGGDAAEQQDWWPPAATSGRGRLLMALHEALADTHVRARVTPRHARAAGAEHLSAIALVAELDAFVLVASVEGGLAGRALLESAQLALQADQLLSAVCVAEPVPPFMSVVIDRHDVVEAIETPSGRLRPPRQSRPPAPISEALVKFLDATITPFGRLAGTLVEGEAIDPRQLAADVSADAVRTVAGSARGYKVAGKRPGYERVARRKAAIVRLVESALSEADVDVASILEIDE